jgi:carnitine 3-dehydrogenase
VWAYDPAPGATDVLAEVHANAATAWAELGLAPATLGGLTLCPSIEAAVDGAELVQESVPERLVVAHPFNPVYLLPLVEVVAGERTSVATVERAMGLYRSLGMHPLHVRVEIDAFIADRLLEAVWREALWLVDDGVATTAEIDDAIRYGFGLRWAQMGLFETYRIAGGLGGMRQFIAQFGEALQWPWTKLTDVPELTDELIDRIADQSDAQSGHLGIRELERLRDRNLAAILLALEANRWGAGQAVAALRSSPA